MLKYSQVYDHIVAILYSLKAEKQTGFFSLLDILMFLDYPITQREVYSIANYLEAKGYVTVKFEVEGAYIEIAPQGIVHIEDKDIILELLSKEKPLLDLKDKIAKFSEDSLTKPRLNIVAMLDKVIAIFKANEVIRNSDVAIDADILKLELQKISPDKLVVETKLATLSQLGKAIMDTVKLKEAIYAQ